MNPSPEEIKRGKEASKQIEAYKKFCSRCKGRYGLRILLGLVFVFSMHKLGAGRIECILLFPLFIFPTPFIRYWLWRRNMQGLATIEDLRGRYGTAIDFLS
jgi:hypothetical protein